MFLKRFYDDGLAQASYLIGCQETGEAIVIDPNRDIAQYVAAAKAERLRIAFITETHIHADFVSGSRELAHATGGQLVLSAEGGKDWQYGFAAADGARLVRDGDVITLGNVRLQVMHTPGHTPEHISFLVTDGKVADEPIGIVTGDFVFVGDVGRPDLLERTAKVANTMEAGARDLFRSLERFRALPDFLQVWPGHGAGSACGKSLGAVPTSTVGYEKRFNWGVSTADEKVFVESVLAGQPDPPNYFATMKRVNRDGPAVLGRFPAPAAGGVAELAAALAAGDFVIDTRTTGDFGASHAAGTVNIPINKSFPTYAGSIVPFDVRIAIIANDEAAMRRTVRELVMIGYGDFGLWFPASVLAAWHAEGRPTGSIARIDVAAAAARIARGEVTVVDVRNRNEWDVGHIAGATHIPLGQVAERHTEIPRGKPILVQCQSGARSAIIASLLHTLGTTDVINLSGGLTAWESAGHEVVRDPVGAEAGA